MASWSSWDVFLNIDYGLFEAWDASYQLRVELSLNVAQKLFKLSLWTLFAMLVRDASVRPMMRTGL
jgi:hypothetical protein